MSNKANQFVEWLDQVEGENLTDYELAKAGKFSHSVLSRARSGIPPKWDVCVKIAGVLNISPITVFRKAGLLPQGTDDEINMDDWRHLLKKMTRQQRDYLMQIGGLTHRLHYSAWRAVFMK